MDYQKAYSLLAKTMSNAIDEIEKSRVITLEMDNGIELLKRGLEEAEEMYLSAEG